MLRAIKQYTQGKKNWNKLIQTRYSDKTLVIVIQEQETEILFWSLYQADSYAKQKGYEHILFITQYQIVCDAIPFMVTVSNESLLVEPEEMDTICHFLIRKIDTLGNCILTNVRMISLTYPYGEEMRTIFKEKIFPADYLVWNRMYHGQQHYAEEYYCHPVAYTGENDELKKFFQIYQ